MTLPYLNFLLPFRFPYRRLRPLLEVWHCAHRASGLMGPGHLQMTWDSKVLSSKVCTWAPERLSFFNACVAISLLSRDLPLRLNDNFPLPEVLFPRPLYPSSLSALFEHSPVPFLSPHPKNSCAEPSVQSPGPDLSRSFRSAVLRNSRPLLIYRARNFSRRGSRQKRYLAPPRMSTYVRPPPLSH